MAAKKAQPKSPARRPYIVPNPAEWAGVIEDKRRALHAAEEAYANAWLLVDVTDRKALVAAISEDVAIYEKEGSVGDTSQDDDLEKVIEAFRAFRKAELDARQGRLFPEGPEIRDRGTIVSLAQVERGNLSHAQAEETFKRAARERAEIQAQLARQRESARRYAEETLSFALKSDTMKHAGRNKDGVSVYAWSGKTASLADWTAALSVDGNTVQRLREEAYENQRRKAAEWEKKQKEAESAKRKAKMAAAKQPLPKGYTVEKGRRGRYEMTAPDGSIRFYENKADAVTAAIAHHDENKGKSKKR